MKPELLASAAVSHAGMAVTTQSPTLSEPAFEPLFVPLKRAVDISGLGRSTLYREAMRGRLRMVKAGRSTLVDYASCQRRRQFGASCRSKMGARRRPCGARRGGGYWAAGGLASAGEPAVRRRRLLCARR